MHRLDHASELLTTFNVLELDLCPRAELGLVTLRSVVAVAVWEIGGELWEVTNERVPGGALGMYDERLITFPKGDGGLIALK